MICSSETSPANVCSAFYPLYLFVLLLVGQRGLIDVISRHSMLLTFLLFSLCSASDSVNNEVNEVGRIDVAGCVEAYSRL